MKLFNIQIGSIAKPARVEAASYAEEKGHYIFKDKQDEEVGKFRITDVQGIWAEADMPDVEIG
ncbi:MAG: hypothetical protein WD733_15795 [Bryobacterales bacterium]